MTISSWECCGRHYTPTIKTCRTCGKVKPNYGVLPDKPRTPTKKQSTRPLPKLSERGEEKFFQSCKKMIGEE